MAQLHYLLAFSGGLDSTVLLYLLTQALKNESGATLSAIHIHHGLQNAADDWVLHCQRLCDQWQVPLRVLRVNAHADVGESPEAAARSARYHAFKAHMTPDTVLVTGHHQDDQAETVLLQLLRGAGAKGLCAMAEWKPFGGGWHYRPLLTYSRSQLTHVASNHGLTWIEDPSNDDVHYARNALRHRVLPLIAQFWPGYRQTLTRSARLLAESDDLLTQFANEQLMAMGATPEYLPLRALSLFVPARQALLLRTWLMQFNQPLPSERQLKQFLTALITAKADRHPTLPWGALLLYRHRQALYWRALETEHSPTPQSWCTFPLPLTLETKRTLWAQPVSTNGLRPLQPDEINTLQVRYWHADQTRATQGLRPQGHRPRGYRPQGYRPQGYRPQGSDRFHPAERAHSQTLKKLLNEWQIPPALKGDIPFLYCGDTLIAIVGFAIAKGWQASENGWQLGYNL